MQAPLWGFQINIVKIPLSHYTETSLFVWCTHTHTHTLLHKQTHRYRHTHSHSQGLICTEFVADTCKTLHSCLVKQSGRSFIASWFYFTVIRWWLSFSPLNTHAHTHTHTHTQTHTQAYLVSALVRQPHNGLKRYTKQMVFQLAASLMLTGHVTQAARRRKRVREIRRQSGNGRDI